MNTTTTKPAIFFFDINETLLDIREVKESVGEALGGGPEVVSLWFTMMLHYSLVATVSAKYEDFDNIGIATLMMLAKSRNRDLHEEEAQNILAPILTARPYPDVLPALTALKDADCTIVALANSTRKSLTTQLTNAGIVDLFDRQLSIQDIGLYKPHRDVYTWAAKSMRISVADCMLVAAHGWDVAGALAANMRAAFVSRPGQQLYPLSPQPEIIEKTVEKIAERVLMQRAS